MNQIVVSFLLFLSPRTPVLVFFLRLHAVCVTHSFATAKRTRGEGHILGIACLSSSGPKEWLPLVCLGNVHSTDHQTNLEGYLVDHVLDEEIGCKLTSCTWESVAMRWEEWIKIELERVPTFRTFLFLAWFLFHLLLISRIVDESSITSVNSSFIRQCAVTKHQLVAYPIFRLYRAL